MLQLIPVVDLFAGAGGLGEGFSSIKDADGNCVFDVGVSIEKDQKASETLKPSDFIIEAEKYGIPQRRHRVILFGVRRDHDAKNYRLLVQFQECPSLQDALSGMPKFISRLSHQSPNPDSVGNWLGILRSTPQFLADWDDPRKPEVEGIMAAAIRQSESMEKVGARFVADSRGSDNNMPTKLCSMIKDPRFGGVCQHETRSHMPSDLHRYLFAACYAEVYKISPKLDRYPPALWPEHKNLNAKEVPFDDRFRVQCWGFLSTTVVSHIQRFQHQIVT